MTQEQVEQAINTARNHISAALQLRMEAERHLRDLQGKCTHPRTEYWCDPSGNNGGGLECKVCGKWL